MKKSDGTLDIELIKLLCTLSILADLQKKSTFSAIKEYDKLSIRNILD